MAATITVGQLKEFIRRAEERRLIDDNTPLVFRGTRYQVAHEEYFDNIKFTHIPNQSHAGRRAIALESGWHRAPRAN